MFTPTAPGPALPPGNFSSPAPGQPPAYPFLPNPARAASRTLLPVRWGLVTLLLPGLALVITVLAAALTGQGTPEGTMMAIGAIAGAAAAIAGGGSVAHGIRHWGAAEPSSAAWAGPVQQPQPWQPIHPAASASAYPTPYPSAIPPQQATWPSGEPAPADGAP